MSPANLIYVVPIVIVSFSLLWHYIKEQAIEKKKKQFKKK